MISPGVDELHERAKAAGLKEGREIPMRLSSDKDALAGTVVRFSQYRRWATLVVAVLLGAGGGSMLGFLTAPGPASDAAPALVPTDPVASSTSGRPRGRVAGVSSSTTRARRGQGPAASAGLAPAPTASSTTPTTLAATTTSTTLAPTTSTLEPTTSSGDPTSSSTTASSVGPPTPS